MRRTKFFLISLLTILTFSACGDDNSSDNGGNGNEIKNNNKNVATAGMPTNVAKAISGLEFPKTKGGSSTIIVHMDGNEVNYSTEWDNTIHSQRWSCYTLTTTNTKKNVSRYYGDPQYPHDADLQKLYGYAEYEDDPFYSSGFDHGHICPSADRLSTSNANYQTFYLTNMQPQYGNFNQKGTWYQMEIKVRNLAPTSVKDTLFVVKGGTIDSQTNIIKYIQGRASVKIPVPKYFFVALLKKIYDTKTQTYSYHAFGFWFEHKNEEFKSGDNLGNYIVNIDELEKKTGIDFFCNLPDDIERQVQSATVSGIKTFWGFK